VLGMAPRFGYATSPLIEGDLVVVEMGGDQEGPGTAAFDRETGELKWQALEVPSSYSSPIAVDIAGSRQLIFSRSREVVALSPQGEQLWRYETGRRAAIPVPIFLPPDRLFISSSDDSFGGVMLRVSRGEEGFQVEEAWTERRMRNHFNSAVRVGDYLYGFDNATLKCLDARTGELKWGKRGYGKGSSWRRLAMDTPLHSSQNRGWPCHTAPTVPRSCRFDRHRWALSHRGCCRSH